MRQIALAIQNYASAYGHLPPAYVADEDGNPMYSWRVLILPFIEGLGVFEEFDFDEPWDGPKNRRLLNKGECFFQNEAQRQTGETNYKLIVGPETAFVRDQTVGFNAISAGASNTVLLVEDTVNPVCWMAPEDVTIGQAVELFDRQKKPATMAHEKETRFSKTTTYYSYVALMDGSIRSVGTLEKPAEIRDHFTVASVPAIEFSELEFQYGPTKKQVKAEAYMLVGFNFLLAVVPIFWGRRLVISCANSS